MISVCNVRWINFRTVPGFLAEIIQKGIVTDETKIKTDSTERYYICAAVDGEAIETLVTGTPPGRLPLVVLLFLRDILVRCRGRYLVRADHGLWYDWWLEGLDYKYERETWGNQSLIEFGFDPHIPNQTLLSSISSDDTPTQPDRGS